MKPQTQTGLYDQLSDHDRRDTVSRDDDARTSQDNPRGGKIPEFEIASGKQRQLMGILAHELRNPVACIKNAIQVLRLLGPGDALAAPTHDIVDRQVAQLTRLIEDLLVAVGLPDGRIPYRPAYLDVAEAVRDCVADRRGLFNGVGLRLTLEAADVPVWIWGDAAHIQQILSNLLTNAAKFTNAGGCVAVSLEEADASVVIRVRDTGVGIESAVLSHLFSPFVQSERTLGLSQGGFGLGLSVVKSLCCLHGGEVQALSDGAGKGSEFIVRLPRDRPVPASC